MHLLDFMAAVQRAPSIAELDRLLKHYLEGLGFSGYTFSYFGRTRGRGQELHHEVVSQKMRVWHDYYHEEQHDNTDSTHHAVYKSLLPIFWSVAEQLKDSKTMKERKMRESSLKFGVMAGLSIPLHGPGGDFAELTLRQFQGEECMKDWASHQQEWLFAALAYFNCLREQIIVSQVSATGLLTTREMQCLNLLAENYAVAEIANRLSMSERTVNFHIQNINHKFKVRNKYEALSKAKELGVIA